jgi:hypothetical protein
MAAIRNLVRLMTHIKIGATLALLAWWAMSLAGFYRDRPVGMEKSMSAPTMAAPVATAAAPRPQGGRR